VVIVPPEGQWAPIQAIRRRYDRQVRRWMPHITLLFPFRPVEEFDAVAADLAVACGEVEPFEVALRELRWFGHGGERYTLWLVPEPAGPILRLHDALWRKVPDCDEVRRFPEGFTPHLSVGQVRGRDRLERVAGEIAAAWRPMAFTVRHVCLIWRNEPPDDVFRVGRRLPLGGD